MSDIDRWDHALVASLIVGMAPASSSGSRSGGPLLTSGMLIHLASIGLVGAAIIICFGIASFSFLNTGGGTLENSTRLLAISEVRAASAGQWIVGEASATDASLDRTVLTVSVSGEKRDQLFHEFERYYTKPVSGRASGNDSKQH
jgi:hypothetical protein